jgi:geranylgeranyl diphosphate synthase type II
MKQRLAETIREYRGLVEGELSRLLPEDGPVPELQAAMRYAVMNGGKRLRPILLLMVNQLLGGRLEDALPAACAVEIIHSSSLVFDDLPSMDDARFRRGKKCLHLVFPEGIALMAADALMNYAFEIVAEAQTSLSAEETLEMLRLIARTIGPAGMVGGQAADLQSGEETDFPRLRYIHMHKTAVLFVNSARLGVMTAHGSSEDDRRIARYARAVGLAFQIVDDALDRVGDARVLGKEPGIDDRHGRMTFVRYYGMEKAMHIVSRCIEHAVSALEPYGASADPLRDLAEYIEERKT